MLAINTRACVTATDGLNLRSAPAIDPANILRTMSFGTQVDIVDGPVQAAGRQWWRVRTTQLVGFAAAEFLDELGAPGGLDPAVLVPQEWIPIDAPIKNSAGDRSPANYDAVIDQFGVEINPRYQPTESLTFCNIFVSDVTRAMQAEIPHRINSITNAPDDTGRELTVNGMVEWLMGFGAGTGWEETDARSAQEAANVGRPAVLTTMPNVPHEEEHTTIIRPGAFDDALGVLMAQAGARCLSRVRQTVILVHRPVKFWVHD